LEDSGSEGSVPPVVIRALGGVAPDVTGRRRCRRI